MTPSTSIRTAALCFAFACAQQGPALAQEGENMLSHDIAVSLAFGQDLTGAFEYNLADRASVTFEAGLVAAPELVDDDVAKETGDSLSGQGFHARLIFSRYTQPERLAGFYFGVGAGYRQQDMEWTRTPKAEESWQSSLLSQDGHFSHEATMSGATGNARVGYRYVGYEYPFMIGVSLGMRHFNASYKDKGDADAKNEAGGSYAETPDEEQHWAKRQVKTGTEFNINLGWAF